MSKTVEEQRAKDLEEVRAIREQNERRAATHNRVEMHREVHGVTVAGEEKSKPMEVHAFDGRVNLNTHGELVLDREGLIEARRALDAAFQAVT